jgi:sugar (pentulose or hexulose) kinase
MIGTSGALRVITPRPVLGKAARNWCYAIDENHWLTGGAINNGGIALAWLRDVFNGVFPAPNARKSWRWPNRPTLGQAAWSVCR